MRDYSEGRVSHCTCGPHEAPVSEVTVRARGDDFFIRACGVCEIVRMKEYVRDCIREACAEAYADGARAASRRAARIVKWAWCEPKMKVEDVVYHILHPRKRTRP